MRAMASRFARGFLRRRFRPQSSPAVVAMRRACAQKTATGRFARAASTSRPAVVARPTSGAVGAATRAFSTVPAADSGALEYQSTSPYARVDLARNWTPEELDAAVQAGYRHPREDVKQCLLDRDIPEALRIFEGFKTFADNATWNRVIWAHARTGHLRAAADLFFEMTRDCGIRPDENLFGAMFKAMLREGAIDALFKMYEEELRPRLYIRPDHFFFMRLFEACEESRDLDTMDRIWSDFHDHYEYKPKPELWQCRLRVEAACGDWARVQQSLRDMVSTNVRVRAPALRGIVEAVPVQQGLPPQAQKLYESLRRSFAAYSVRKYKERHTKIFFKHQLEIVELVDILVEQTNGETAEPARVAGEALDQQA